MNILKKWWFWVLIILVILFGTISYVNYYVPCDDCGGPFLGGPKTKLQICPDEWYDDQMPCVYVNDSSECDMETQYFIIDNERRELSEFDVDWIKENCEINEPSVVY